MANNDNLQHTVNNEGTTSQARQTGSILSFLMNNKVSTAMWVLRVYILSLCLQFMFNATSFYIMNYYFRRILLSNALVCSLRLHQRVPTFHFSRSHFSLMMQEDSAHYLVYSVTFLTCTPMIFVLFPIFLFSLLHTCSFTRQIIDVKSPSSFPLLRRMINYIAKKNQNLAFF